MIGTTAQSHDSHSSVSNPAAARTTMLLQAPIPPTLLRLAAPNVLNLLALVGLITFDGLFLGRLGPDALAGVSLVFPWVMLMQHSAASGMGGAVAPAIARTLGACNRQRADHLATHAVWLALLLAAVSSLLMLFHVVLKLTPFRGHLTVQERGVLTFPRKTRSV